MIQRLLNSKFYIILLMWSLSGMVVEVAGQSEWPSNKIIEIRDVQDKTWQMKGFEATDDVTLNIEALGGLDDHGWYAKGWILEATSRDVFWEMDFENTERGRRREYREFSGDVSFPRGIYEVYFGFDPSSHIEVNDVGDIVSGVIRGFKRKHRYSRDWGITLEVKGDEHELEKVQPYSPEDEHAIVQMITAGDNEYLRSGFSLNREIEVNIYMLGEGSRTKKEMFDYGWIINANTRERVWKARARRTKHAGGALKNRLLDDVITLPEGEYVVYYITDDSHSAEGFNMMPPYDPLHWGITIWALDADSEDAYSSEHFENIQQPIIEMTGVGENQVVSDGFEVLSPTDFRIYAIGELGSSGMVDYGWIIDAHTREIVWEMSEHNTEHAGGGRKNRFVDEVIELPRGAYMVYYTTDIGHSFGNWNTQPPYDPEYYGITVWGFGPDFDPDQVRHYDEEEDERCLVALIRMRDHVHRRQQFRLDERTKIRIYAVGEGSPRKMYDYGWIEEETGDRVWQMRYDETSHAGGARKNRLFNDTIILPAGEYVAHYRTDDSHSFEDWNAAKPADPVHWGITILIDE